MVSVHFISVLRILASSRQCWAHLGLTSQATYGARMFSCQNNLLQSLAVWSSLWHHVCSQSFLVRHHQQWIVDNGGWISLECTLMSLRAFWNKKEKKINHLEISYTGSQMVQLLGLTVDVMDVDAFIWLCKNKIKKQCTLKWSFMYNI